MLNATDFSYAPLYANKPLQKYVVKCLEALTARSDIYKYYQNYLTRKDDTRNVWDQLVEETGVAVEYDPDKLAAIPKTGPVIVVANHPFGVIDGIVINYLVSCIREDYKVLTNSVLSLTPEVEPYLIKINFDQTRQAIKDNLAARKQALEILNNGGCIVAFPAGRVMTTQNMFSKQAYDADWQPFVGKLIQASRATVVPMFFEGQNSRLFQAMSHISLLVRVSLFLHEFKRHIKKGVIPVRIGDPIPYDALSHLNDRTALIRYLQNETFSLGGIDHSQVSLQKPKWVKEFASRPFAAAET